MRIRLIALLLAATAAPLPAQQTEDQKAVLSAIEKLFTALKADDTAGMRAVMHPQGRIIQTGTHAELSTQEGLYRRLWQIQTSVESDLKQELKPA